MHNRESEFEQAKNERMYFPELDGLRFFAFLLVFISHQSLLSNIPYLSSVFNFGWIGVDLFFSLSAYLFTKLLISENLKSGTISFRKFYARRVFRIWPVYYFFVGFSILYFLIIVDGVVTSPILTRLIGLLTFTDNIFCITHGYDLLPFITHLWTIAYEEQFYVFIPVLIFILTRSSHRTKIIWFVLSVVIFNLARIAFIYNKVPHPAIYVLPFTHFESIILGIALGFGGFDFLLTRFKSIYFLIIGILLFLVVIQLPNVQFISYWLTLTYSIVGLLTSFIVFSVLHNKKLIYFFSISAFVFLGKRSYGLYVYHTLGMAMAHALFKINIGLSLNPLSAFVFGLFFTIVISIISYRIIEKPFLLLKKKYEIVVSRPI